MSTRSRESDAITQTFDLAERILDEVAAREQDWRAIESLARELAEFARSQAASSAPADRPRRL